MGVAPMERSYFVYIMSNVSKMLYVGVTNGLQKRVFQHKTKLVPGFTEKYNLYKLVYFEIFADIRAAIAREKEIKGWLRSKKVALIIAKNPQWNDLAENWFKNPAKTKTQARGAVPNPILS
jgi:putative endonuclease